MINDLIRGKLRRFILQNRANLQIPSLVKPFWVHLADQLRIYGIYWDTDYSCSSNDSAHCRNWLDTPIALTPVVNGISGKVSLIS